MYKVMNYYESTNQLADVKLNNNSTYLIFATQKLDFDIEELNSLKINYYGAIFPKIIFENKVICDGFLLIELDDSAKVIFYESMSKAKIDDNQLEFSKSLITVFDGFSPFCTSFVENVFEKIKLDTSIFGGGAGSFYEYKDEPIFSNSGKFKDAAFLITLEKRVSLGISHGWKYLVGPYTATKGSDNILSEIDYENAFEVYKNVIEKDSGIKLSKENFFKVSMKYPFGIVKFNGESLIRDPYDFDEDGNLILASSIQSNSIFNILKGDKSSLIDATSKACREATKNGENTLLIFECITRLQFLKEDFDTEINEVIKNSHAQNIFGVFSVGEVGNDGNRYIYILNKSIVMGGLCH